MRRRTQQSAPLKIVFLFTGEILLLILPNRPIGHLDAMGSKTEAPILAEVTLGFETMLTNDEQNNLSTE